MQTAAKTACHSHAAMPCDDRVRTIRGQTELIQALLLQLEKEKPNDFDEIKSSITLTDTITVTVPETITVTVPQTNISTVVDTVALTASIPQTVTPNASI